MYIRATEHVPGGYLVRAVIENAYTDGSGREVPVFLTYAEAQGKTADEIRSLVARRVATDLSGLVDEAYTLPDPVDDSPALAGFERWWRWQVSLDHMAAAILELGRQGQPVPPEWTSAHDRMSDEATAAWTRYVAAVNGLPVVPS